MFGCVRGSGDDQPKKIALAMSVVIMPAVIGIQVRRTTAMGETPAAPPRR